MPNLNLHNALEVHIASHDALAIRIANVNIWEKPAPFVEYSNFKTESPTASFTGPYAQGNDLHPGAWVANHFFTYGAEYAGATVAGVRYWVPVGSSLVGESIKIRAYQTPTTADFGWNDYTPEQVTAAFLSSPWYASFPTGTLVEGWNDLRFEQSIPVEHYHFIVLGVSVGDGTKYLFSDPPTVTPRYVSASGRIALSGDTGGSIRQRRGVYCDVSQNFSSWSSGHYGIDALIQVPITPTLYDHSIWTNTEPDWGQYNTYGGLGAGGWTTAHFYGKSSEGQAAGWTLAGVRLWVPPADRDTNGLAGMSAQYGYYVKAGSSPINNVDDTPTSVLNGVIANAQTPIVLKRGWNDVMLPTPVAIPINAGVAVGWKIGTGDVYVSNGLGEDSVRAFDQAPFFLASSSTSATEKRGTFREGGGGDNWSYNNNHYGADIIVREPGH